VWELQLRALWRIRGREEAGAGFVIVDSVRAGGTDRRKLSDGRMGLGSLHDGSRLCRASARAGGLLFGAISGDGNRVENGCDRKPIAASICRYMGYRLAGGVFGVNAMWFQRTAKQISGTVLLSLGIIACCSCASKPDNAARVRQSLGSAGYKDVRVSEDTDKGVMTLTGQVASDNDKSQADSIAKGIVGNEVVSNEIAVVPRGAEGQAKTINSDIDKGIRSNLDAALVAQGYSHGISYTVNNGVVTLTGNVSSQDSRKQVEAVAAKVPYVQQVVNELQVKNQKASSSN